jgi:tight adherence protein C
LRRRALGVERDGAVRSQGVGAWFGLAALLEGPLQRALRRADRKVQRAGLQGHWSARRVVAAQVAGLLVGGALGLLLFVARPSVATALTVGLFPAIGLFLPDLVLDGRARRRRLAIERSLPEILDQLTICVGAGLGFDASLRRVASSNDGDPLAAELGRAVQDMRMGMVRTVALTAMAERCDASELRAVVRAVVQSDRAGVPISRVLRVQADHVRERRRLRAEERAMRMPVKLIFPLVLCVLPALFVVLMGPAVLRLARTGIGA